MVDFFGNLQPIILGECLESLASWCISRELNPSSAGDYELQSNSDNVTLCAKECR
jgi:hypothetical protein